MAGLDANSAAYWPANEGPDEATTWSDLTGNESGNDTFGKKITVQGGGA